MSFDMHIYDVMSSCPTFLGFFVSRHIRVVYIYISSPCSCYIGGDHQEVDIGEGPNHLDMLVFLNFLCMIALQFYFICCRTFLLMSTLFYLTSLLYRTLPIRKLGYYCIEFYLSLFTPLQGLTIASYPFTYPRYIFPNKSMMEEKQREYN